MLGGGGGGGVTVEHIVGLTEVEYVVIYVSIVVTSDLIESANSLETESYNFVHFGRALITKFEERCAQGDISVVQLMPFFS